MTSAVTSFCSAQSSVLSISREARLVQTRDQRLLAISLVMRCPARHNYAADTQSAVECRAAHGARGGVRGARLAGVAICVTRLHPRLVQHRGATKLWSTMIYGPEPCLAWIIHVDIFITRLYLIHIQSWEDDCDASCSCISRIPLVWMCCASRSGGHGH